MFAAKNLECNKYIFIFFILVLSKIPKLKFCNIKSNLNNKNKETCWIIVRGENRDVFTDFWENFCQQSSWNI